jgi:predicted TIM-barrel fold metal-dependent hydrolase
MKSQRDMLTVDADGHVLEPVDTWERYIDPAFRDRALRVGIDSDGFENLFIDNRPTLMLKGRLGALGGIEADRGEKEALQTPGERSYADGAPLGGYDPAARLVVMDEEGIDKVLLYPTIGIAWEGSVRDPELALAYTRAYNRWIVDFCREAPDRLYPIAHITLLNPDGAVEEVQRARRDGCVGVYLSPDLAARSGLHLDDPAFRRFFDTVQDLEMPVAFHVVAREASPFTPWFVGTQGIDGVFAFAFLAIDVMAAFTQMLTRGLFERHARLRCAVLEAGSNWITAWLDRLDHKVERGGFETPLKLLPSEYFRRQCVISADPDETLTAPVVEHLGADLCVWASDYPHLDADFGVVAEIRSRLSGLPEATQRKVLGENVVRFYGLEG